MIGRAPALMRLETDRPSADRHLKSWGRYTVLRNALPCTTVRWFVANPIRFATVGQKHSIGNKPAPVAPHGDGPRDSLPRSWAMYNIRSNQLYVVYRTKRPFLRNPPIIYSAQFSRAMVYRISSNFAWLLESQHVFRPTNIDCSMDIPISVKLIISVSTFSPTCHLWRIKTM